MSLVLQAVTGVTLFKRYTSDCYTNDISAFNTQFNMQTRVLSPTSRACALRTHISCKLSLKCLIQHTHTLSIRQTPVTVIVTQVTKILETILPYPK